MQNKLKIHLPEDSDQKNNLRRRNFFALIGRGIVGLFIFSVFPFKMKKRKLGNSIKVSEHPLAVKIRNKKG